MSIYTMHKDTYKQITNTVPISKSLSDSQVNEFNACCDVCKTIDKNIIMPTMTSHEGTRLDEMKSYAYKQINYILNNYISTNPDFIEELSNQLKKYNIDINDEISFTYDLEKNKFYLRATRFYIMSYTNEDIYNILNSTVLNFTNAIYKKVYQNEKVSKTFDYFKDISNAGIRIYRSEITVMPDIADDIVVELKTKDVFKGEDG